MIRLALKHEPVALLGLRDSPRLMVPHPGLVDFFDRLEIHGCRPSRSISMPRPRSLYCRGHGGAGAAHLDSPGGAKSPMRLNTRPTRLGFTIAATITMLATSMTVRAADDPSNTGANLAVVAKASTSFVSGH